MSIFKKIIWTNTFINIIILFTISWVLFCFLYYPLPERTKIEDMNDFMIAQGQGIALKSYEICFWILIFLFPISIIISSYIVIKLFSAYFYTNRININWMFKTLLIIYSILCILLGFIFWYFQHLILQKLKDVDFINIKKFSRFKVITRNYRTLVYAVDLSIVIIPIVVLASNNIKTNDVLSKVPLRKREMEDSWTLSANKPNTMVLYFDRATGLLFNELLALDYLIFKDYGQSMAQLYPEFTSYINTLSLAQNTNISVPSIYGSWYSQPLDKDKNKLNPFSYLINSNKLNSDLTIDQWILMSHLISTNLLSEYGYKNLSILEPPYYDKYDPNNKWYRNANSTRLQKELNQSFDNKLNINVFDVREVYKALDIPLKNKTIKAFQQFASHDFEKNSASNDKYGYNKLMNDKINLSIKNKDNTFMFYHQNFTHEKYYVINSNIKDQVNDKINNNNPSEGYEVEYFGDDGLWASTWYMIQKLKNIFDYLKNLPYTGDNSNIIKNQYDNTSIYIVSDHGNFLNQDSQINAIHDYLIKGNLMTSKQSSYLKDFIFNNQSYIYLNSTFAIKPRKFINNNWNKTINTSNPLANIFDNSIVVTSADLYPIMESYLFKENLDLAKNNLMLDETNSFFKNKNIENLVINPFENILKMNNRKIPLVHGSWTKGHKDKTFGIDKIWWFKSQENISVYNKENFK